MEKQLNQLGQAVANAGADAKYDAKAKELLANKPFLAWILKFSTKEFSGLMPDEIIPYIDNDPQVASASVEPGSANRMIMGLSQESTIADEGSLFYDIRFYAKIPGTGAAEEFNLMIDVEMQNDPNPGYDLISRGVLYCGRMLSEQMGRNVYRKAGTNKYQYQHLQKVYSIWIVNNCSQQMANTISKYGMKHEAIYGEFEDNARCDLLNVVMIRLPAEGQEKKAKNKPTELHSMLTTVFSQNLSADEKLDRLENDFKITVTEKIRKEVTDMCNLSYGIRNQANEDTARRMIRDGKLSDQDIANYSDLTVEQVQALRSEEEKNQNKPKEPVVV